MKTITAVTIAALALSLGACGGKEEQKAPTPQPTQAATPAPKATPAGPKKPLTPAQVEVFHESMEKAMAAIPPELREPFQKVWNCEIAKNSKLPPAQQVNIDGDWVVKKTAELKANPSLANCQA